MDHRCLLDTPTEELPSERFRRSKVYVDPLASSLGYRHNEHSRRLFERYSVLGAHSSLIMAPARCGAGFQSIAVSPREAPTFDRGAMRSGLLLEHKSWS